MTQYDEHRARWDQMSPRTRRRKLAFYALLIVVLTVGLLLVLLPASSRSFPSAGPPCQKNDTVTVCKFRPNSSAASVAKELDSSCDSYYRTPTQVFVPYGPGHQPSDGYVQVVCASDD